jgi:(p)ppGpp synthase/HD superfamily hydrolase
MREKENFSAFFARLSPCLAPIEVMDARLAYILAKYSHRWQTRRELDESGQPRRYFEHLRRTALILIDELKIFDRDLVIAALLHDGIEDTRELTPEMIEHCFGSAVAGIVRRLSKVPKEGYTDRLTHADWRTLLIKACDRLDNLRTLGVPAIPADFRARQVRETREKYYALFDRLAAIAPPELGGQIGWLRDEIRQLTETLSSETQAATPA